MRYKTRFREYARDRKRQEAERKLEEKLTSEKLGTEAARHDQLIPAEGFTAGYDDGRSRRRCIATSCRMTRWSNRIASLVRKWSKMVRRPTSAASAI